MLLDTLDQKTVNSLPDLPDVYDAYGVQVNALSVSEIFALYEHTGFLYPEKAARLFPHLGQVRENWRRMLGADESLLYVLTAGDKKRGRASLAVWRTTHHGWMSQHLVCENNPYASRAVMLAAAAGAIRKGSDLSAQNWFRPENRFPARVFGSMASSLLSASSAAYEDFELDEIPVIAEEMAAHVLFKLGAEFLRHYCQGIWLKNGHPRFYRHVDGFYSKLLARIEKHQLQAALVGQER